METTPPFFPTRFCGWENFPFLRRNTVMPMLTTFLRRKGKWEKPVLRIAFTCPSE